MDDKLTLDIVESCLYDLYSGNRSVLKVMDYLMVTLEENTALGRLTARFATNDRGSTLFCYSDYEEHLKRSQTPTALFICNEWNKRSFFPITVQLFNSGGKLRIHTDLKLGGVPHFLIADLCKSHIERFVEDAKSFLGWAEQQPRYWEAK